MWRRGQSIKNLFLAQSLAFITFPVYISSLIGVVMGKKMDFIKTPKEGATSLPLKNLLPQILMMALTAIAVGRGVGMAYLALSMHWWERFAEVIMNILWASFHLALLFQILKFNKTLSEEKSNE
jgi:ABC-type dipeptide/oligopeptide/nickel transport system permease subunit